MFELKVLARPLDKVVLEHSLDKLVEDVRGYEFINVGARKVVCERLARLVRKTGV